jgi:MFS superfamily sulfate permease-like transporter
MDPGALAGAGIVIGAFFVLAGFSGLIDRIAKVIPPTVASGLQLGLGLSLAALGIRMMADQLWLGVAASALMLVLLPSRRFPAALVALVAGVAVGQIAGIAPPLPALEFGLRWPAFAIPTWEEVLHGTQYAVLPQIPLTLTNAIIVAAAVARQLYPGETRAASERTLALTQGFGTLVTAPFGGYPMCHGAGGIAAHHRFGARTAAAPVLIGVAFLLLGILFGDGAFALLRTVPEAVLGGLLLFSGIDLALSAKLHTYREAELFLVILMAAVGVALNPAAAFAVGLPIAYALKRGWLKF